MDIIYYPIYVLDDDTLTTIKPETYKEDLLEAFATGKGPDIFMVRNAWRESFENKTAPAPQVVISEKEYRDALVDVAATDFLNKDNQIYGIPLSVDSLALYYTGNKELGGQILTELLKDSRTKYRILDEAHSRLVDNSHHFSLDSQ